MGNTLKYKGHFGSVEASPEDDCLFEKLQFIRDLVSYEGHTVRELEQAFHEQSTITWQLVQRRVPSRRPRSTKTGISVPCWQCMSIN